MKNNLAIFLLCVAFSAVSLRADDATTNAVGQSSESFVQNRLKQIDLNMQLKQYEKISNELADASADLSVAERLASSDADKQTCQKMKNRVLVLSDVRDRLRGEVIDLALAFDAQPKHTAEVANSRH
jgi:hypothetical protein